MPRLARCAPSEIDDEAYGKICILNHDNFKIDNGTIKRCLYDKDTLHLYYDDNGKLVGVVGFKWTCIGSDVFMYVGCVVIDHDYQRSGLLSQSLVKEITTTFFRYPHKRKFALLSATTPQAYCYITKGLSEYWPRHDKQTPHDILSRIEKYMIQEKHGYKQYHNDAIITEDTQGKIIKKSDNFSGDSAVADFFTKVLGGSNNGSQLMCVVPFSLSNFWGVVVKAARRFVKKIR